MSVDRLHDALARPQSLQHLSANEWEWLIAQARAAQLLARLALDVDQKIGLAEISPRPRRHLEWALRGWRAQQRALSWDIDLIARALSSVDTPIVLLKGIAYVMGRLPPAAGRVFSDIDIMVRRESLDAVEAALSAHNWLSGKHNPYDQHYYRTWMHELPPLHHAFRRTVLDVHHTITPPTSRHRVDAALLFAAATRLDLHGRIYVLAPPDMLLHSITHLMQEGEFEHGLRDLTDVDDLFRHFGRDAGFWPALHARAAQLGLGRPLYYAAHQARHFLATPMPPAFLASIDQFRPDGLTRLVMGAMLRAGIAPERSKGASAFVRFSRWLLYIRGHYLRMPLRTLIPHLARKIWRRRAEA